MFVGANINNNGRVSVLRFRYAMSERESGDGLNLCLCCVRTNIFLIGKIQIYFNEKAKNEECATMHILMVVLVN